MSFISYGMFVAFEAMFVFSLRDILYSEYEVRRQFSFALLTFSDFSSMGVGLEKYS